MNEESQRQKYIADDNGSGAASHRSAPADETADAEVQSNRSQDSFERRPFSSGKNQNDIPIVGGLVGITPQPAEQTKEQRIQEEPSLEQKIVELTKAAKGMALAQQFSAESTNRNTTDPRGAFGKRKEI